MALHGLEQQDSIEISVVIPCYNSAEAIKELHARLEKALHHITPYYEIIYINDCSADDTILRLSEIASNCEHVIVIDLMFNVGQYRAVVCGLEQSKGNYVFTMDDDLQQLPEEINKLYSEIRNNAHIDAVIGSYKEKKHSFIRNIGTALIRKTMKYSFQGIDKKNKTSSFRCLSRPLVNSIVQHKTMFPSIGNIIRRSTNRIKYVLVDHCERKYGKSNYSITKLLKIYINMVFNYTSLPLRIVSFAGIALSVIGFSLTVYYLYQYFFSPVALPGWTTLVVLINFYFGLLLLSVGIIGEYILKILHEVNGSPRYMIRNIINQQK